MKKIDLGEILRSKRKSNGLTQAQLAAKAGVSQGTIGNIESGIRGYGESLVDIARALEVSVEHLRGEENDKGMERPINSIPVDQSRFRNVPVIGKAMGGMPDRLWGDGDYPVGGSDCYAEIASQDPNAFIVPIEGESMSPRFNPGEYALVEPNTAPELEDDVIVKLGDGRIMIKRLLSQRAAIRLGSYNSNEIISAPPETIIWMYYVAHPVPARKIKQRT